MKKVSQAALAVAVAGMVAYGAKKYPTPVPKGEPSYMPLNLVIKSPDIGVLDWSSGKLVFTGNADKAATVFFNEHLKKQIDLYIKQRLKDCR